MEISKKKLIRVIAVVGIGLLACAIKLWLDTKSTPAIIYANSDKPIAESSAIMTEISESSLVTSTLPTSAALPTTPPIQEKIPVYICGAVFFPGIYFILPGIYLYELIEQAGGLLPDAASEYMNLVFQVSSAVSIYIPFESEMSEFLEGSNASSSSSEYLRAGLVQGIWGTISSPDAVSAGSAKEERTTLININTADQNQLETLPGVGPATAKAIISYREKSGGFTKIEDIMNVAGIKEGRFESIREFITI